MGEAASRLTDNVARIKRDAERRMPDMPGRPPSLHIEPGARIEATEPAPIAGRVVSVDALRGFTILWILGADGLALSLQRMLAGHGHLATRIGDAIGGQFTHAEWEGLRFYDLVFPLFIFTTGVAIVLSLTRLVAREGKAKAHARVLRRSLLLFVIGVLFYGGLSSRWPDIRLLGVLQRIALCYLFASILFLNIRLPGLIASCAVLLVGYWALMTFVPVPGVGAASYARDANLANWIDLHYLPGWKWEGTWDPEGLLSTLPAIATCLIGVFAGMLLMNDRLAPQQKSLWLIGGGIGLVLAGHLWGLQFPIIKQIWTSSFALVAGGYGLLLLGLMHQLIDVWRITRWATILVWIGANAIMLYVLNSIAGFEGLARRLVGGDVGDVLDRLLLPGAANVASHAVGLALAIWLAGFFHRRKIFLRV